MLRGLYTAAAGMITEQRRHDTATQNIVNMNTTGYKQVNSVNRSFPEMLITLTGGDANLPTKRLGRLNSGVFAEELIHECSRRSHGNEAHKRFCNFVQFECE